MLTLQNLKDNRNEIIAKISELGCEDVTSKFMTLMVMEVEGGYKWSVEELVSEVHNMHFRIRAKRSGHTIAEICGNGIKANGTERNDSITKYL